MTTNMRIKAWLFADWPNRISLLRLLLVAPFVFLLMKQQHWPQARYAALGVFAVMAISDFLDGVLARALNARTRLGAILDPLADKVLIICSVILLSLDASCVPGAQVEDWVVLAVVAKDLWVVLGFIVVYLVTDRFRVHPTLAGKASTAAQLVMVLCVLLAPDLNRLGNNLGSMLARALGWVVAGVCLLAIVSYTRLGLIFITREEKPLEDHSRESEKNNHGSH
jgi:CDP-diacylglycerol--glycerol-3-phosphate 3-phosphatidyltransferase